MGSESSKSKVNMSRVKGLGRRWRRIKERAFAKHVSSSLSVFIGVVGLTVMIARGWCLRKGGLWDSEWKGGWLPLRAVFPVQAIWGR